MEETQLTPRQPGCQRRVVNGCIDGTGIEAACAAQGLCGGSAQTWCCYTLGIPALGTSDLAGGCSFSLAFKGLSHLFTWDFVELVL